MVPWQKRSKIAVKWFLNHAIEIISLLLTSTMIYEKRDKIIKELKDNAFKIILIFDIIFITIWILLLAFLYL